MIAEMVPEMLTIKECADRSGLSYDSIRKMVLSDKIVYIKVGRKTLINWSKFLEYLNKGGIVNDK